MKLLKTFFICLALNLVALFVLQVLTPSAAAMNMPGLMFAYLTFGVMLMVGSDLMFIKALWVSFKGKS